MPTSATPAQTWRPGGARYVAYSVAAIFIVMTVVIGVELPEDITFTIAELATLAVVLGSALALLHGVGRSRVVADDAGVSVRNGYRDHDVAWADIEGFSFNQGAPWPTLVTTADDHIMLFAIQGTDGGAQAAVDALARRQAEQR